MTRIVLVLAAATATAPLAGAQSLSFDRLALELNQGDRVTVTDSGGQKLQGRIVDLSPSILSLQAGALRRDLNRDDVSVVRRRERDSLTNGAVFGFASGVGVALALILVVGEGGGSASWYALFGAAGAGIGAGLDSLHQGSRVIYRAAPSNRRLAVSPRLSRDGAVLSVSLGF